MDIASYYFLMLKAEVHDRSVQYPIPAVSLHRSEPPASAIAASVFGLAGFTRMATVVAFGAISCSNSNRFD
jgi:hypothetical protein